MSDRAHNSNLNSSFDPGLNMKKGDPRAVPLPLSIHPLRSTSFVGGLDVVDPVELLLTSLASSLQDLQR